MIYIYYVFSLIESAFHWMMMPEPEVQPEQHRILTVQELLDSPEYLYVDDSGEWLKMKLHLDVHAIAIIAMGFLITSLVVGIPAIILCSEILSLTSL